MREGEGTETGTVFEEGSEREEATRMRSRERERERSLCILRPPKRELKTNISIVGKGETEKWGSGGGEDREDGRGVKKMEWEEKS